METKLEATETTHGSVARERILTDLKTLVRDAEDLLKATSKDASEMAKEARARLGAALERTKSTCQEVQDRGIETARTAAKKADSVIHDHPYESIGVAFGVGLLLGVLLREK